MNELKHDLRKIIKREIKTFDQEFLAESNHQIIQNLLVLPEFSESKTVFCYVGVNEEINTVPIIQMALELGKVVAVPLCTGNGIMEAHVISAIDELTPGYRGILEPLNSSTNCLNPREIDLLIVPCLSANSKGQRIGYGGGFYDRYLKHTIGVKVVLCREKLVHEDILVENHDQKMDILVTEEKIINIKRESVQK
ncbi:MAG: 5-formyltetrahydrofolate cyclo-ligase [Eubacteriales bacterium]